MTDGKYSDTLRHPGFFAFFCTQFLGAFNDNFLKIVVSFVALDFAASRASGYVELIAFLFILPAALFSGYAGHFADVYSKRTILVTVKIFEIFIMLFALGAFVTGHIESMLAVVFLMGQPAADWRLDDRHRCSRHPDEFAHHARSRVRRRETLTSQSLWRSHRRSASFANRATALAYRDRNFVFLVPRGARSDQHSFLRQRIVAFGRISHRAAWNVLGGGHRPGQS